MRLRKTKDPCAGCKLHLDLCICDLIPRLDLRTRLTLVVHAKELKRTTNTGRLAIRSLVNSEMRVRGLGREALDLSDRLEPSYEHLLFFPSDDAVELDTALLAGFEKPVHLIVPDGNWRQASKVVSRHPELAGLKRVKLSVSGLSDLHLRAETRPSGMATLEAIAQAFRVLEGEEVFHLLARVYMGKLERTLIGRGQLLKTATLGGSTSTSLNP